MKTYQQPVHLWQYTSVTHKQVWYSESNKHLCHNINPQSNDVVCIASVNNLSIFKRFRLGERCVRSFSPLNWGYLREVHPQSRCASRFISFTNSGKADRWELLHKHLLVVLNTQSWRCEKDTENLLGFCFPFSEASSEQTFMQEFTEEENSSKKFNLQRDCRVVTPYHTVSLFKL